MGRRKPQRGMTLLELMLAIVAGVIVLGALNGVVAAGLRAQAAGRQVNELVYGGQFALQRMRQAAWATAPKPLTTPVLASSTGDWFAPTMYCLRAGKRLVETTVSDAACSGPKVIAENVLAFSAQPASGAGPVDAPLGTLTLTLQSGGAPITLSTSVRLGGGTL